jgi:hypothetical protein
MTFYVWDVRSSGSATLLRIIRAGIWREVRGILFKDFHGGKIRELKFHEIERPSPWPDWRSGHICDSANLEP